MNCTQEQYQILYENINEDLYHMKKCAEFFKNMTKLYINPCTNMETRVRVNRKITADSATMKLKFKYSSNRYLEILNKKAFGEETLLAQTGGYIGKMIIPL